MKLAGKLSIGDIVKLDNKLLKVRGMERVRQGKGGAFVQVVMFSVSTGQKIQKLWRVEKKIETTELFNREATYLYNEGSIYYFLLDNDQIACSKEKISFLSLLEEGMDVTISMLENNNILSIYPPKDMISEVKTILSKSRCLLKNGIEIKKCPSYIKIGTKIKFNVETSEFIERL